MFKRESNRPRSLFALLAFVFALALHAQTVDTIDPALKARIDRVAEQVLALRGIPSASIAVVEEDLPTPK